NYKNNFKISSTFVERLTYQKIKGISYAKLYNPILGNCVTHENAGGVVLHIHDQSLLAIPIVKYDEFSNPHSLAIPVSTVKKGVKIVVPYILPQQNTTTNLGLKVANIKKLNIDRNSLKAVNAFKKKIGVKVIGIEVGSVGEDSAIKLEDIILKFDGETVDDVTTFKNLVKQSIGRRSLFLTILRDNKVIEVEINRVRL
ncbi:MAG: PDZ domain-containing protein, partial [Holosporales bacterium]|nr:PDZ domain-containing protein [Holosporales bacterium]